MSVFTKPHAPIDSMYLNEHVKAWRWHWFERGLNIDRNGYYWLYGQKLVVQQNDYLSHGIMPRGCENMLWEATIGEYDLGCKIGRGATKMKAIEDLMDQMEG